MTLREHIAKSLYEAQPFLDENNQPAEWRYMADTTIGKVVYAEADAALATLRTWLAENGLVVVPRDISDWPVRFTQFASGEIQDALEAAPATGLEGE
jgi:hypothetical protein